MNEQFEYQRGERVGRGERGPHGRGDERCGDHGRGFGGGRERGAGRGEGRGFEERPGQRFRGDFVGSFTSFGGEGGRGFGGGGRGGRGFGGGGRGFGGPHDRGERGFGSGRERMFDAGDLQLIILQQLALKPSYGYELMKAIEERLSGGYTPSPGVVYPTLTMLEERGLAEVQ